MSRQGTIKRYTLIIEKINRGLYPTLKEIETYLFDHGFEISKRTLQRNIEQIRDEFGIEIIYDQEKKGYFIDKESSIQFNSFLRFLEIANTAELITESIKDSKKTLEYISFDNDGTLKGISNLKILLQAIKEQKVVTFTHYNFDQGNYKERKLYPYLLKEYLNRWYVIGLQEKDNTNFRTFGIDRISNLTLTTEVFVRNQELHPQSLFSSIIGVIYPEENIQEVVLKFTPFQGKYIKTLPLHHSQEILIDNDKELTIRLWIKINYELKQRLLMLIDQVEVLKPIALRDEMKQVLTKTLNNYN
ncbi:WYL domain-containing protein [uncultured Tenacibaculum sp.]|uniref:helix-turn-helix transcriptional regulator n=1 Tax=uncultured Tenacibaculum sp. TaxID=174713 RepID=UPI0026168628|nr:WYL domain-containing protein [uncultured Tenacibaculum sp.]